MIGQVELKKRIISQIEDNTFPQFSILIGQKGSGRKTMCGIIATHLNAFQYKCSSGVEDVRKMISYAYTTTTPMLYVIADADGMSTAAKNTLLKITEEPPKNAYFIMTLTDINNTLSTIRSRSAVYHMNLYTPEELQEYGMNLTNFTLKRDDIDILKNICETPGEVQQLFNREDKEYAKDFYSYANKVVDNIAEVSGSNAFKIGDKIAFKEDADKYDLRLFWKAFMVICASRLISEPLKYSDGIKITSRYLQELRTLGINKQATFDMWLLDVRKEWM